LELPRVLVRRQEGLLHLELFDFGHQRRAAVQQLDEQFVGWRRPSRRGSKIRAAPHGSVEALGRGLATHAIAVVVEERPFRRELAALLIEAADGTRGPGEGLPPN